MASVFRVMYTPLFDDEEPSDTLLSLPPFGESFVSADTLKDAIEKIEEEVVGSRISFEGNSLVSHDEDEDEECGDEEDEHPLCTSLVFHSVEFICNIDVE
ncbi:MAG: hypothetical protein HC888_00165 [Candidatus Competibacteraceae bacterium]|nr:hypothetical protein [Candidatus Competibacteraceae bacterium]